MIPHLVDTNILVYAVGASSTYRDACRRLVEAQGDGALAGETTAIVVQEFLHQRLRQTGDRAAAVRAASDALALYPVHDVAALDVHAALRLFQDTPGLDAADAVMCAVAVRRGIEAILSVDRAFDGVPGLRRVDPLDAEGVAALGR